jgi:hypothetical protein
MPIFRTEAELTRLSRFFGKFPRMVKNIIEVWKDTRGFIDMDTLEPYFIREYWINSGEKGIFGKN